MLRAVDGNTLVRDALEVLFVIAIGGILWSSIRRLRAGQITAYHCVACGRPTSRAYPRCKHCDAVQPHGT